MIATLTLRHCRLIAASAFLLITIIAAGCGDPLRVSDPSAILEENLSDAQGAELLRRGALRDLYRQAGDVAWASGLFADEFLYQPPSFYDTAPFLDLDEMVDRRMSAALYDKNWHTNLYDGFQGLRIRGVPIALRKLQAYAVAGARGALVGEMFAVRGYITMRLAEDVCPGFPLHEVSGFTVALSPARSTQEVFGAALADLDSAVGYAADSARVLNFARIARARTLLNLGRFADAAVAVALVPTSYAYRTEQSPYGTNSLGMDGGAWRSLQRSVADREGTNGLDFVSAQDPRVTTVRLGTARNGQTGLYGIGKYPTAMSPVVLASGVEARLIEAEAALKAGDPNWLTILNTLRATQVTPALGALADPGTDAARVDLIFRERAFWLFATGTRLADLRRLVRTYGRSVETVFPTGPFWRGGTYGSGSSIPFPSSETTVSPGITGCTAF